MTELLSATAKLKQFMAYDTNHNNNFVEIYAIGNELLVGQVLDTNTHWLIRNLTGAGAQVRRAAMIRDHVKMTDAQMEAASGDRAKFRHIEGSQLLQVMTPRSK